MHPRPTASLSSDGGLEDAPRGDSSTDNSIMLARRWAPGRDPSGRREERGSRIMKVAEERENKRLKKQRKKKHEIVKVNKKSIEFNNSNWRKCSLTVLDKINQLQRHHGRL